MDLLERVESHLRSHPGEYRWTFRAEQWGVDAIELSRLLLSLEASGRIERKGGRRFWLDSVESEETELETSEMLVNLCVQDLKRIVFCSVNAAQLLNKLSPRVYDIFTLHRAVPLAGGIIGRCAATQQILYYKFSSEI